MDSLSEIILARQVKLRREMLRREANVEAWAASSCWDIKISSANYFALAFFLANKTEQQGGGKQHRIVPFDEEENTIPIASLR